jgi:hypothetical protein
LKPIGDRIVLKLELEVGVDRYSKIIDTRIKRHSTPFRYTIIQAQLQQSGSFPLRFLRRGLLLL